MLTHQNQRQLQILLGQNPTERERRKWSREKHKRELVRLWLIKAALESKYLDYSTYYRYLAGGGKQKTKKCTALVHTYIRGWVRHEALLRINQYIRLIWTHMPAE